MKRNTFAKITLIVLTTFFVVMLYIPVFLLPIIDRISMRGSGAVTNSTFSPKIKPIYADPIKLVFETLNKELPVVRLSTDANGGMETPKDWGAAGWFMFSSKPGDTGNMVINGHYDDSAGRPAAFYGLKNLQIGDKVVVVDKYGRSYAYSVVELFFLDVDDPSRFFVLGGTEGSELTLITCGGYWLPDTRNYSKRLIIKARLIS